METLDKKARANNHAFLQTIEAVAHEDSPENRRLLYEAMLKAWFLVPTKQMPDHLGYGRHALQEDARYSFPIVRDARGKNVIPAFTDEEALAHGIGASPWFAVQGSALFRAVVQTEAHEIAVNPPAVDGRMIRPGGRITRAEFALLAEGKPPRRDSREARIRTTVTEPQRVFLGMPARMPSQGVLEALAATA